MPEPPDPSAFYRLNEELARELARLSEGGQLDRLRELLAGAGAQLVVSAARPQQGFEEVLGTLHPERWDHESVLPARSRFRVVYPDGTAREVYMPDHVCPSCLNDAGNALRSCARVCAACGFTW